MTTEDLCKMATRCAELHNRATNLGIEATNENNPAKRVQADLLYAEWEELAAEYGRALQAFRGLNGNDPGGRWSRPKAAE